jgi:hypothetical protein
MHLTDYHAKYFAHELTKRCASDSMEKLASTLVDAQVDLNPIKSKRPCSPSSHRYLKGPFSLMRWG